jgi:hypothetical protein
MLKGPGEKKKRIFIFFLGIGAMCLAWFWSIPSIYIGNNWEIYMALSFFLVLIPLVVPSIWKKLCNLHNT